MAIAVALPLSVVVALPPDAGAVTPPTVVSLTFDDSNSDQLTALATMQADGLHGTFYAISGSIGSPNYLTLANLHTIANAGNEIGGHTVNHPDLTLETADEAQRQVCDARNQLTTWGFPQTSFAYPYATINASVEAAVQQCGYNSGRGLGDVFTQQGGTAGLYAETIPPPNAYALRAPDEVDSTWTLQDLENTVTNAETHGGGWDLLTFHHICEPGSVNCDPTVSITPELFAQFASWLSAHLLATPTTSVKTVTQVIGGTVKPPVTAPPAPATSGAMTNSSLETAITPGVPNCWSAYTSGTSGATYAETTNAHTGTVAEQVTMAGFVSGDAKIMPTFDTGECSPSATVGHSYQLGAWYESTVNTQFALYYRNATGGFDYWTSSPYFPPSATYTQAVWTTPPLPAGYSGISFGLNIFANGTLTTDDYSDLDATAGTFVSLAPSRLLDTRAGLGGTAVAPGATLGLQVAGRGGVPASGVSAVVLNVTAVAPTAGGYLTVWGTGATRPTASNLNFSAGQTVPNLVVSPVGTGGRVSLFNGSAGTVQLLADVAGYYLSGTAAVPGAFVSLTPSRLLDTRAGLGGTAVAPGATLGLQVAGRGGVPASGVSAVVLNVTVTQPTAGGYLTVWGTGATRPTASNLNFSAGQTVPNLVVSPVGTGGQVSLFNGSAGTVQLLADVAGYYLAGTPTQPGTFVSLTPSRLLDTRAGLGGTVAGPGATRGLQVAGRGGVPASGASAVVLNVTAVAPTAGGYLTVWGTGATRPTASNLNFSAGQTVPNLVVSPVGTGGQVSLFNGSAGTVQLLADVAGYFLSSPAA